MAAARRSTARGLMFLVVCLGIACAHAVQSATPAEQGAVAATDRTTGWQSLFDGRSLANWRASDTATSPSTFRLQNGEIVVRGTRSHLYYQGPVANHDFKNFELKAEVYTLPRANSGIYFHTRFQPVGFPDTGFEVQVDNSHTDPKRTAGLYDIKENYAAVAKDSTWFTMTIHVEGKHVTTFVDDKLVVDWTEPEGWTPPPNHKARRIASGTFALQGHDPGSEVHFRNIRVRVLP
jgi:hypothetical protein